VESQISGEKVKGRGPAIMVQIEKIEGALSFANTLNIHDE